jgi:hypothetical protein
VRACWVMHGDQLDRVQGRTRRCAAERVYPILLGRSSVGGVDRGRRPRHPGEHAAHGDAARVLRIVGAIARMPA